MKIFRRTAWMVAGAALALWATSRAKAYVRANTPRRAREFVLGPDEESDHLARRTLAGLAREVRERQRARERQLAARFTSRSKPTD